MNFKEYLRKIKDDYSLIKYPCVITPAIGGPEVSIQAIGDGSHGEALIYYADNKKENQWKTRTDFITRYGHYECEKGKCPYCGRGNYVPSAVYTEARRVDGPPLRFECLCCKEVVSVQSLVTVTFYNAQKTDEGSKCTNDTGIDG